MLYAEYDEKGKISAAHTTPREPGQVPMTDKELQAFLKSSVEKSDYKELLRELDTGMIRALEDVVELLMAKNVIMFTDLPEQVQNKLNEKKAIRSKLRDDNQIVVDDIV